MLSDFVRPLEIEILGTFLSGAVAAGDVGLVGGFFDSVSDGFGDAFIEHGGDDVFGMELER
jgi:hypothetical protein